MTYKIFQMHPYLLISIIIVGSITIVTSITTVQALAISLPLHYIKTEFLRNDDALFWCYEAIAIIKSQINNS